MSNSRPIWTKPKWKKEELNEKTVEFDLVDYDRGFGVHGVGQFRIGGPNPKGLLFVQIEVLVDQGRRGTLQIRYYLPQVFVDRIRKHPDQTVAAFEIPAVI
jgi:hypothetical protein